MAANLRLASLDGTAVPLPPQAQASGTQAAPARRAKAASPSSGADHSTFRAMVGRLHDSGLESILRGLLASVAIVEEELLRRGKPPTREAVPAQRAVPSRASMKRTVVPSLRASAPTAAAAGEAVVSLGVV